MYLTQFFMMIFKKLIVIILIHFLLSCSGDTCKMHIENCSEENSGLITCIRLNNSKIELNIEFEIELVFKNVLNNPIQVYLINNEFFRSFQSYFYLLSNGQSKMLTDISPPHGYVVTESDFHIISSNSEKIFKQTLRIDEHGLENDINNFYLKWVYVNDISRWMGGVETLDGPTKRLFDGKDIPYIWLGEIESTIAIEIIK